MKLNTKVASALNEQINSELQASYTYLAMAAYFDARDLPGFASWFRAHSVEETGHAMRIYDFINRRNARVELKGIAQPAVGYESVQDVVETAIATENTVTEQIHSLFEIAAEEKEYGTQNMLQWFLDEQIGEEDLFNNLLTEVKAADDNPWHLLVLDKQLAQRAN